jgi:hypothetical protein
MVGDVGSARVGEVQRWAAALVGMLWSALVIVTGLVALYAIPVTEADVRESGDCESVDHPEPCAGALATFGPGVVLFGAGLWGGAVGVALLRRSRWARRAGTVTYSVWASVVLLVLGYAAFVESGTAVGILVTYASGVLAFAWMAAVAARLPDEPGSSRGSIA